MSKTLLGDIITLGLRILLMFINRTKWVNIKGQLYKRDAGIIYNITDDSMEVAIITNIYIINGSTVLFKGKCFYISGYKRHYRAHILTSLQKTTILFYDHLPFYIPLHPRNARVLPTHTIITLPYYFHWTQGFITVSVMHKHAGMLNLLYSPICVSCLCYA